MKTNEEAKQEAIKAAYGENWDKWEHLIDSDGWLETEPLSEEEYLLTIAYDGYDFTSCKRPSSLRELDDNRGWTRIEPDGSNLPTDDTLKYKTGFFASTGKFIFMDHPHTIEQVKYDFEENGNTHYKPIIEDKPPIY